MPTPWDPTVGHAFRVSDLSNNLMLGEKRLCTGSQCTKIEPERVLEWTHLFETCTKKLIYPFSADSNQ